MRIQENFPYDFYGNLRFTFQMEKPLNGVASARVGKTKREKQIEVRMRRKKIEKEEMIWLGVLSEEREGGKKETNEIFWGSRKQTFFPVDFLNKKNIGFQP